MRVKIGLTGAPRELDLDIEDADEFAKSLEAAVEGEEAMVWVTALDGRRHGVVVSKLAYVEWEPDTERRIGFVRG